MEMILKTAGLCVSAAVIATAIKKDNPSAALLLAVAAVGAAAYMAASALRDTVEFVEELASSAGMRAAAVAAILKTVGIAVVTRIAADVCADAGMKAASSGVELAGAAAALMAAAPLMKTVYGMITELL